MESSKRAFPGLENRRFGARRDGGQVELAPELRGWRQ